MSKPLSMKELLSSLKILSRRNKQTKQGTLEQKPYPAVNRVAELLHPGLLDLEVVDITPCGKDAKRFRFVSRSKPFPLFEAGQYMTLSFQLGSSFLTRPYSISSAPYQSQGEFGFIEIIVKRKKDGLVSSYLLDQVSLGAHFQGEVGLGDFVYDEIRDQDHILAIAGGSGVTPFLSLAKEINHGTYPIDLTILYGSRREEDILALEEITSLESERVHIVHVLSEQEDYPGEKGFFTKELLQKYGHNPCSYFLCGPLPMMEFVDKQLEEMGVKARLIRHDYEGIPSQISSVEDFPLEAVGKTYTCTVHMGIASFTIPCSSEESLLVALERAGKKLHSSCRAGYCGYCRTKLLSGEVYIYKKHDSRRAADVDFNYVHACCAYPLSDVEIRIPIAE